jgi:hypothetical protein
MPTFDLDPGGYCGNPARPDNEVPGTNRAANRRRGILTLPPRPGTITAQRLKITTTLDAAELATVPAPEGKQRVTRRIKLPERTLSAEVASKSLRKAQKQVREAGAENIVLLLQGRLTAGDVIAEAGGGVG